MAQKFNGLTVKSKVKVFKRKEIYTDNVGLVVVELVLAGGHASPHRDALEATDARS